VCASARVYLMKFKEFILIPNRQHHELLMLGCQHMRQFQDIWPLFVILRHRSLQNLLDQCLAMHSSLQKSLQLKLNHRIPVGENVK